MQGPPLLSDASGTDFAAPSAMFATWMAFGEPAPPPARLVCGLPALDRRLGGGLPQGRLTEIIGPPQAGKTALVLALLRQLATTGSWGVFVDLRRQRLVPRLPAGAGLLLRPSPPVPLWSGLQAALGRCQAALWILDAVDALPEPVETAGCLQLLRLAARLRTAVVCTTRGPARPGAASTPLGACSSQRLWLPGR